MCWVASLHESDVCVRAHVESLKYDIDSQPEKSSVSVTLVEKYCAHKKNVTKINGNSHLKSAA